MDSAGNACLTGYFGSYANFGSHLLTSSGYPDIFVATLSSGTPVDENLAPGIETISRLDGAWPNPLRRGETVQIKTFVTERETGTLTVFNLRGQTVTRHTLGPGSHQISLDSKNLPSGVYLYQLQTGTCSEAKKLVVFK